MKRKIENIVILGSGNIASHLAFHLDKSGYRIKQIYSRTFSNAQILANKVQACACNQLEHIEDDADVYIVAVSDHALAQVVMHEKLKNKCLVHTSGSTNANILKTATSNYGVFYPFQTFSKAHPVDFTQIPILIEANTIWLTEELTKMAQSLSENVLQTNSEKRAMLHVAAVFACNFSNHMYAIAYQLLKQNDLPFSLLLPLINETAAKANKIAPKEAQTGPAVRFDQAIMDDHIAKLNDEDGNIYKIISQNIQKLKTNLHDK